MARWSDSGGDMVPAVTAVSGSVVRITSMSVAVLCTGSVRVGEVMVVKRLFSIRKLWKAAVRASRLMLMSPLIVIAVVG